MILFDSSGNKNKHRGGGRPGTKANLISNSPKKNIVLLKQLIGPGCIELGEASLGGFIYLGLLGNRGSLILGTMTTTKSAIFGLVGAFGSFLSCSQTLNNSRHFGVFKLVLNLFINFFQSILNHTKLY